MGLRRRRRQALPGLYLLAVAVVLALTAAFWLVEATLRPTFLVLARNQAEWTATRAMQEAVLDQIGPGLRYEDLVHLERDAEQRIVYLGANVVTLNRLAAAVTLAVQQRLERFRNEHFSIPLGQVLGSELLANYGPRLEWQLVPTGVVRVRVKDEFQEAGINQTRHYLALHVESVVRVIIPFSHEDCTVAAEVPLVDAIIVGNVPQTLMRLSLGESGMGFSR